MAIKWFELTYTYVHVCMYEFKLTCLTYNNIYKICMFVVSYYCCIFVVVAIIVFVISKIKNRNS